MLRELEEAGAVSRETGFAVGSGHKVLPTLQKLGLVNRGRDRHGNEIFWVRQPDEPLIGASTARGWIVTLSEDVQAPSGKSENLFLARSASYDGSSAMFSPGESAEMLFGKSGEDLEGIEQDWGLEDQEILGIQTVRPFSEEQVRPVIPGGVSTATFLHGLPETPTDRKPPPPGKRKRRHR